MPPPIVFFSYSPADESLRDELRSHLSVSMRQGVLCTWHDRRVEPGQDVRRAVHENLDAARVILLLISADYLASDACYEEMERALERDRTEQTRVIPIILRDCDWQPAPFARLVPLPRDGRPVVRWPSRDEAWEQVARRIRETIVDRSSGPISVQPVLTAIARTSAPQFPQAARTAPSSSILQPITRRSPTAPPARRSLRARIHLAERGAVLLGVGVGVSLAMAAVLWLALRDHEDETDAPPLFNVAPSITRPPAATGVVTARPGMALPGIQPPSDMVLIRAGTFLMGTEGAGRTEGPPHRVTISRAFFLDRTEVTTAAYQRCVEERRCSRSGIHDGAVNATDEAGSQQSCNGFDASKRQHPINCVDQEQALTVCSFYGKRLPTEAEWEYAARGIDGRLYPWGNTASCALGAFSLDRQLCGPRGTREVGSFPSGATLSGALDMAGNVFEWVADGWDPDIYGKGEATDPRAPINGKHAVLRGGGWDWDASSAKSTFRLAHERLRGNVSTGVRCARTAE